MPKKYSLKENPDKTAEQELKDYNKLTRQLLFSRGVRTQKEAGAFLEPDFVNHLHDPFLLPDMKKAVERILEAIDKSERIGIWSDYDADGIPGGALLYDFFKLIGFNNFVNYIPDRHAEGYGLNSEGMEELAKDGAKLLITRDCGIRDHKEIEHAKKLGIEIIVTDHHEPASAPTSQGLRGASKAARGKPADNLPDAYAVINPKRSDSKYPEKVLCGTGVVWKLIEALRLAALAQGKPFNLSPGKEKWLLDLVGLATLSDMVPLTGENRVLASYGLKVLRKSRRPGFQKLFYNLKINKNHISEDDIAFMITPRINAASRMGHPRDAFKLLIAETDTDAEMHFRHLDNINNERKGVVAGIVKEAKKKVKEKFENEGEKPVIVLGNPDWRPALLGLAANSIAEEYNRPVFLWGRSHSAPAPRDKTGKEEDVLKGSCRSDGVTDLVALMERAKNIFSEFGGHKMSGGFSVLFEKISDLENALIEASTHIVNNEPEILVDAELKLQDISEESVAEILRLAPFGTGNEKPLFIFRDVVPEKINRFGKAKEHLSINFRDGLHTLRAISFFTSPDQFGDCLKEGIKTNLVANIEKSFYNGSAEIRLRIVDFFS